jgi:hypothetical protein
MWDTSRTTFVTVVTWKNRVLCIELDRMSVLVAQY